MGIISDTASRWAAEARRVSSALVDEQSAAAALLNQSKTDWPALRPKIVDAINVVAAEVNSATVGTSGTSSFGQFSATTGSSQASSGTGGGIESFWILMKCTKPQIGSLIYITAHGDYTVKLGLAGSIDPVVCGFAELLAGGAEAAVRSAVARAMW